ncbi:MAG: DnaJ domain-containing protein [Spirochaetales bacterium]|nr:DnaJ domain-containing protein [Spirochaetales bacterium]
MINYYEILGVKKGCSQKAVKQAFRKKIKELHPDLSGGNNDTLVINEVLTAYKVLTDKYKRKEYDRIWQRTYDLPEFNYREFLKSREDDYVSQSKLVFYDLLNDYPDEAIELYEKLLAISAFKLEYHPEYADYMECIFLIAEEYMNRAKFREAYDLLREIYFNEQNRPFFKNYMVEIIDRMKQIALSKLEKAVPFEEYIEYLKELAGFNLSRKDYGQVYKKIAEIFLSIGERETARKYIEKGLSFNKSATGLKKLIDKLA